MPRVLRLVNEFKALTQGSIAAPAPVAPSSSTNTRKRSRKGKARDQQSDDDDSDYTPPKKAAVDKDDLPDTIFGSDGEEIVEESDLQKDIVKKRLEKKSAASRGDPQAIKSKKAKKKRKVSPGTVDEPIVFDSAEESDGDTALKRVQEVAAKPQAARRGPANKSMQHFKTPVAVKDSKMNAIDIETIISIRRFARTLKGEDANFQNEPRIPHGFNNLSAHVKKCTGLKEKLAREEEAALNDDQAPEFNYKQTSDIMSKFLLEGKLNPSIAPTQTGFRRIFAAWILDDDLPWTTGESPMLANLFKYLKINYKLPSDTAVRNELCRIFAELHGKIVEELANVKSKIAFATDTWTNKQMIYSFACSIASFIDDDWKLIERVIDFRPLESKEHEGVHAARAFIESARKAGAFKKMTMDNATVNDVLFQTAIRALLTLYDIPEQPDKQIRCLAHILNLVAQAILGSLKEVDDCVEDGDETDHFLAHKDLPIHYDVGENTELNELEANRENDLSMDSIMEPDDSFERKLEEEEAKEMNGSTALQRLRFFVTKICSSPQRRQRWWRVSAAVYGNSRRVDDSDPNSPLLSKLMPSRDVRTRWNSTHGMIGRAKILREAINRWVFETPEYEDLGLRKQDWEELETIHAVLEPFTTATLQLSSSRCPTIPFVLPIYDALEKHLSQIIGDTRRYSMSIRTAVSIGKSKLMKYKATAVTNHNYILGTVLHPYLRAEWFRKTVPQPAKKSNMSEQEHATQAASHRANQNATVQRVQTLVQVVAEAYQNEMASEALQPDPSESTSATQGGPNMLSASNSLASLCDFDFDIPAAPISVTPKQQLEDELRRYFSFEGGQGDLYNPLGWWKLHATSFPVLSRMARDILAIPATSVSVERTFSKSRRICTDLRSSLQAETIRKALLTKVWIRSELFELIPRPKPVELHGSIKLIPVL
ncbi:hypothetical protein EST38_g14171 [Candolleomyces aberdarensis]|uniref:HAT C-terminal dimerisation domain-containing protein n=1 Tax=Candolleomyces aberdarensis TaxID=2316362 RepID=A0A4Q2D0P9_9AGAR|nr:hypothetical protein EST38_g14171 [Candolleomyces aberdarensis]